MSETGRDLEGDPNMTTSRNATDRETVRFWLDQEADGVLSTEDSALLAEALERHPDLSNERAEMAELHSELAASRVAVREGFREGVMEALPSASWEPAGRQRWSVAVAAAAVLVVVSGLLLSLGDTSVPGTGLLAAMGEFFRTTAIAGAGLLGASWRGLGLALQKGLESSPATIALFGLGVVALNVLFFRLLRRRSRDPRPAYERAASGEAGDRSTDR